MALTAYQTQTRNLLQNPSAPTALYDTASINLWINLARGQLAGEAACIQVLGTLITAVGTQTYVFSSINTSSVVGVQGPLNVRMVTRAVTGGGQMLNPWPWEWFNQYYLATTGIANSAPTDWTQYGQGAKGQLYLSPTPDNLYTLRLDTICYPINLADDTTVEAIPYPWTDAVPYLAAYYALLSAQTGARQGEANAMFERYTEFVARARRFSTSAVLPFQYEQSGIRYPAPPGGVQPGKGN